VSGCDPLLGGKMRIGVIGSGQVGQVLSKGLAARGYETRIASRTPAKLTAFAKDAGIAVATMGEVAAWAEALVLAVMGRAAEDALRECGAANLGGKLVIDTTNPISSDPPQDGVLRYFTAPNESLMERLQSVFPDARFVKAFNSVGHALMVDPKLPGGSPTMFYCGDDEGAKAVVRTIIEQFGWEAADMGTAKAARAIEPLCQLWCIPGFLENQWVHAFKLLKP
jgi:predicted dinucleotide-binding enzyme